jgi:hypothetical protein
MAKCSGRNHALPAEACDWQRMGYQHTLSDETPSKTGTGKQIGLTAYPIKWHSGFLHNDFVKERLG